MNKVYSPRWIVIVMALLPPAALQRARKFGWNTADLKSRLVSYQASKTWTGNLFAY